MPEEEVWHLETFYVPRNRLMQAAIGNRQAALRGIPRVDKEKAELMMRTLLALRGCTKKKYIEAWGNGTLALKPGDLSMQSTAQRW